ncbi:MAG: DegT/DnrJ/EryC1/StrS aminotransferase [Bacteroidota bacterium]|nr:DegT/DnrJ/EryC1/StrS aminotransferase [Bacteroidota bacterium]
MSENFIPVNAPLLDGNEKKYLQECIDTGWISSEGPFVKKLEDNFSTVMGRKHGIAVCNGSVALDAAVIALGIGKGDEVIMPTFTIICCASAITRVGAIPVLVDAHPETWNMDVDLIEAKITKKTRAIMVVHIYGLPVEMDKILALAKKYDLKIIEDAAEQIGQQYNGKQIGSFGDISCVSFYPNKHITTGEGGMILTDNDQLAEKCRSLRNLCFIPEKRFYHEELGYNYRMTNLQAALGVAQLERLDTFIEKKRKVGRRYEELLSGLKDKLEMPLSNTAYAENIYWVYGMVLRDHVPFNAEEIIKRLGENGIGARPFFWCMHEQPVFHKMGLFKNESYPVGERIARRGFYIPSGLAITDNEMRIVSDKLYEILK